MRRILLGTALLCLPTAAYAQFSPSTGFQADMALVRLGIIALSSLGGFAIGWFCSPRAAGFRLIVFGLLMGLLAIAALVDPGLIGWSATSTYAMLAFVVGLAYGFGQIVRSVMEMPTTFGSAKWADLETIRKNRLDGGHGFLIGTFPGPEGLIRLRYNSDRHLLTFGPTRSGKGTTAIIPNLLAYTGSVLVIDPKGENALITAQHRARMGQSVHVVDPWGIADGTGLKTARFNPLDWLVEGDVDIAENAMLLADALIVREGESEPFWFEEAKALIQGLILFVATDTDESGTRHLGRVRDLLLLDADDLETLFQKMVASPLHVVASTGARCLQKEPKLLSNVLASAQAQTHFLDSARIRKSLSASDFTFEDLKAKPTSIYLVLPSDRLNTFGRWLRLLIQQAITVNARNIALRPPKPVLFLLDEMAALGRLTMIEQAYGLMAGYGIQLWGIVQDISQLNQIYGKAHETFISNAGVLQYFGSRDRSTAQYFSDLCGVTTVWNFSSAIAHAFSSTFGRGGGSSTQSTTETENTAVTQRKLITPDELMRLPKDRQILLVDNIDPIKGIKSAWFLDPMLQPLGRNMRAPAPPRQPTAPPPLPASALMQQQPAPQPTVSTPERTDPWPENPPKPASKRRRGRPRKTEAKT